MDQSHDTSALSFVFDYARGLAYVRLGRFHCKYARLFGHHAAQWFGRSVGLHDKTIQS